MIVAPFGESPGAGEVGGWLWVVVGGCGGLERNISWCGRPIARGVIQNTRVEAASEDAVEPRRPRNP